MNNYYELLKEPQWNLKRQEILQRDGFKCRECFNFQLFEDYRISYCGYGTLASKKVILPVYDKPSSSLIRCRTNYSEMEFKEIINKHSEQRIIALSNGIGDFCRLSGIIVTKDDLDYSEIPNRTIDNFFEVCKQREKVQVLYLRSLKKHDFNELIWINFNHLHIHHKYYCLDKYPWEYPSEALETLCWKCHQALHENVTIPVYNSEKFIGDYYTCPRCYGAGYLPHFSHVEAGICFQCRGKKVID